MRRPDESKTRRLPPGLRLVLGFVLIAGGVFGFLPILGFWMVPFGLALITLDLAPLWRRIRSARKGPRQNGR